MTGDPQFEVTVSGQTGVPVLRACGEIDVASAPEFHASLGELIGREVAVVIVDLSEVTFIDSTGLGVLVGAEKEIRGAGRDLRVVVTRPQIRRVLELTGLDEVFTVMSSTKEAVGA